MVIYQNTTILHDFSYFIYLEKLNSDYLIFLIKKNKPSQMAYKLKKAQ